MGRGGGCLNYVILKWKHILSTKDHTSQFIPSSVLVVNNITNVEWNKLQNWCDALIEVTMYSKVWKRNYYFSIVFKLSNRYKQLLAMLDLLMYQSSDTCIWLGSFLIFGQKLISSGAAIRMSCCAFEKWLDDVYSGVKSTYYLQTFQLKQFRRMFSQSLFYCIRTPVS